MEDGKTIILNSRELCKAITLQQTAKDQTIWMTTAQTGFPIEREEDEVTNRKDAQMGRIVEIPKNEMGTNIGNTTENL